MPFTLAHPAAVLPLARCSKCHFPALILGSLSPDFVYFLGGQASFSIGHTFWGVWLINLPLCFVFYAIYKAIWHDVLCDYLPTIINIAPRHPAFSGSLNTRFWRFSTSALIGMITHLFLDEFTHQTGYFVAQFSILSEHIGIFPLFKWLQYGCGVFGLVICGMYILLAAKYAPHISPVSTQEKIQFWLICILNSLLLLIIWQIIQAITWNNVATWIIRGVDCTIIAFTFQAVLQKYRAKYN
ncbi:DUF4184 family protein [Wielerella bovis]|uniref:DUF4184 family protein n=1 Tax=Wielerella bovis TaxID=2917790 RepID=UPI002018B6D5|nr:DUF4184 family protein [Wielerella bovis]ULJ62939.1 DUF4184 family protein [Wielerella bovis]